MNDQERYDEICRPKLEKMEAKIDTILGLLQGNGVPGYGDRIRTLEERWNTAAKVMWALVLAAIGQLAIWVRGLFGGGG